MLFLISGRARTSLAKCCFTKADTALPPCPSKTQYRPTPRLCTERSAMRISFIKDPRPLFLSTLFCYSAFDILFFCSRALRRFLWCAPTYPLSNCPSSARSVWRRQVWDVGETQVSMHTHKVIEVYRQTQLQFWTTCEYHQVNAQASCLPTLEGPRREIGKGGRGGKQKEGNRAATLRAFLAIKVPGFLIPMGKTSRGPSLPKSAPPPAA